MFWEGKGEEYLRDGDLRDYTQKVEFKQDFVGKNGGAFLVIRGEEYFRLME